MGFFYERSLLDRLARLGRNLLRPTPKGESFVGPLFARPRLASLEDRCLPSSGSQAFLSQVYIDLLQRSIDSSGQTYWTTVMEEEPAADVVLGIETSSTNEYQSDEVNHMYETLLNRPVDAGSLGYWVGVLAKNGVEKTEADIAGSAEFFNDAGGTNGGFLSLLYRDLLNRELDPSGAAGYGAELAGGTSRAEVAYQILTSTEYRTDLVESYYSQFLHRAADSGGLSYWVGQLASGASDQDVIAGILGSKEYSTRAPNAPTVTLPAASETVSTSSFTIEGTAENGSLVQIFSDGSVVGSEQLTAGVTNYSISVPLSAAAVNNFEVTASDQFGNESAATGVPSIIEKTITVTAPPEQKNHEGDTVSLTVSATDSNDKTLTYSATGLPTGLTINSSTGAITGTIATGTATDSPYTVTVSATDGISTSSATFTWLVDNTTDPTVTPPANQTNSEGDIVTGVKVTATGPNKNPLTYSATDLPSGLSINATTGVISGTIAASAATGSPYTVTVSATDGLNTGTATFTWTVTPVVVVTPPASQTNSEGDSVTAVTATATDTKGKALTFSASNLPAGLSINTTTGVISGTISTTAATESPYTVTITATDGTYTGSATFTWTVNPVVVVTAPEDQTNVEGNSVTDVTASATDSKSSPLTFSATNLPSSLSINPTTGVISGTVGTIAATGSPYTVTVTATDGTYSGSATFTWIINPVVVVTAPEEQTNTEGNTVTDVPVTATDTNSSTLTYSASNLPAGLTINPTTGVISGTVGVSAATDSPYTVTVTATDGIYSNSATFTWIVNPVVVVTAPAKQANHEGDTITPVTVSASDTNSSTLTYSATNLPAGLTINPTSGVIGGTISTGAAGDSPYNVTVTATDGTYSGSTSFTWLVDSTADPVVTAPATQESVEGATVSGVTVTATEGNSNPLTYSATNLPSGLTINPTTGVISGTIASGDSTDSPYKVTVTATDGLNSGSATFTWVTTPTTPSPALPFSLTNSAWQTLPSGVRTWDVTTGTGATAASGDTITVSYSLYLTTSGTSLQTESSFSTTLVSGDLITGWLDGIPGMKVGGERRLDIPSTLGYGSSANGNIPANAELVFDITLISVS